MKSALYAASVLVLALLITGYAVAASIHKAAETGDMEKLNRLIDEDPRRANFADDWGCTPLLYAAKEKRLDVVEFLLKNGARVSIKDKMKYTVLDYVRTHMRQCEPEYARSMVAEWKLQGIPEDQIAKRLAKHNETHGADDRDKWLRIETVLAEALKMEEANDRQSPLFKAVVQGNVAEAKRLLEKGESTEIKDENGRTPLLLAITHGQLPIAKLLLAHGADMAEPDLSGQTAYSYTRQAFELLAATRRERDCDELRKLVERGTLKLDATDKNGETALMRAVAEGRIEEAKCLLHLGARTDIKNNKGQSLKDVVCTRGYPGQLKEQLLQCLAEAPSSRPAE